LASKCWEDFISSPNHDAGIDLLTALITYRGGHRDLSLLTEGTDIGVEEQLDFSTQSGTTPRTRWVSELEVPCPVALWTAVVGDDLDLAIDYVLLKSGITIRLERWLALGGREPGGQQRQSVGSLRIEDIDAYGQVHRIARTDRLAQASQGVTDSREWIGA
jgi:hypothetical protein